MKGKKAQSFLLIAVLVVWGIIIYQVVIYFTKDKHAVQVNTVTKRKTTSKLSTDSLILNLNYEDPFHLSISTNINNLVKKRNIVSKPKEPIIKPSLPVIPSIYYKGMINNQKKNKHIGIIFRNQTSFIINEGDTIENWLIKEINKDSILLIQQKTQIWIKSIK